MDIQYLDRLRVSIFCNRTLAIFETASDQLPIPTFAEAFSLTVGELFGWLTE